MKENSKLGYSMSKPKKYKGETIYDYVPDYYPTTNVDNPVFTKLPPGRKDSRMKDVERELVQYWEIIHPMVREYLITVVRYMNEFGEGSEDLEHLRRSLDLELTNSSELSEENRQLKAQISDLVVEKKALNEQINDLLDARPKASAEEINAMKLLISSQTDLSAADIDEKMRKAVQEVRESVEMKKANEDRAKMKKELEEAKVQFEKIQTEVGITFQKKLLEAQSRIDKLEEELAQYKE
ncbi:MAG: hypothetical protein E3J43_03135 [Candidatus Heimdallarchaeota archaeon]|nr:MAG: hypothetical protein E3J43_03135 [Candidatus Heimdallarchaeota archaeon]